MIISANLLNRRSFVKNKEYNKNYNKIDFTRKYLIGNTEIDLNKMVISLDGIRRKINNSEKKVLVEMLSNPGKTFSC